MRRDIPVAIKFISRKAGAGRGRDRTRRSRPQIRANDRMEIGNHGRETRRTILKYRWVATDIGQQLAHILVVRIKEGPVASFAKPS
jgi:hypothetical protein